MNADTIAEGFQEDGYPYLYGRLEVAVELFLDGVGSKDDLRDHLARCQAAQKAGR